MQRYLLVFFSIFVACLSLSASGQEAGSEIVSVQTVSNPVVSGHKYILHVVSGQREEMFAALEKAQQLLDAAAPDQVNQVEVVANESGLNLLRSDVTPFADEVELLQEELQSS